MRLTKTNLLDRLLAAIRAAGWNAILVTSRHPYDIVVFRDEQSLRARIFVWNITHGGGAKRAASEYRIQITGIALPLVAPERAQILLLGWYEPLNVIAAFDPERHRRPSGKSPSIQISIEALREAAQNGLAVQRRANSEIAIAFRPEMLTSYIENQRTLHAFAREQRDLDLLVRAGAGAEIPEAEIAAAPLERARVVRTISIRHRESTFRRRVLDAYNWSCAMCGVQLDLIQAAHIVPVGVLGSTDETVNGLALCALHHEAYDDALVGVREDYRVLVNEPRVRTLRDAIRNNGEDRFRADLGRTLLLPQTPANRPNREYLRRGLELRWRAP